MWIHRGGWRSKKICERQWVFHWRCFRMRVVQYFRVKWFHRFDELQMELICQKCPYGRILCSLCLCCLPHDIHKWSLYPQYKWPCHKTFLPNSPYYWNHVSSLLWLYVILQRRSEIILIRYHQLFRHDIHLVKYCQCHFAKHELDI